MIEKPKRPKKIPNQDNKQPQTIEQLIRRYDLDNTKIYDFLDELVGTLKETQTVVSAKEPTGDNRGKVWIQKGNLYNSINNTLGYYLDNLGVETSNSAWSLTEYISVECNKGYIISGVSVPGIAPYCAYYDSNKNFISSFKNLNGVITIPSNAYYIRFSINGADLINFAFNICPAIYVKNDNDVYEEFMSKDNLVNYSTGEQKIGIWIDGKPLYRKVIQNIVPTTSADGIYSYSEISIGGNIEICFVEWGFVTNDSGERFPLQYTTNSGYSTKCTITALKKLNVMSNYAAFNGRNLIVSVLYTKTTD